MTDWLDAPGYQIAAEHDRLAGTKIDGKTTALNRVLLLDYRCPKRCLLLHVWQTPRGRMFYLPRHQLSAAVNTAETDDLAREHRTEDGDHKWPARGGVLDDLLDFGRADPNTGLLLTCHHLRRVIPATRIDADATKATPGRPTREKIGAHD